MGELSNLFPWIFFFFFPIQFALNDTHFMLTVHWAGEGSEVVVCLARNPAQNADTSSSVFVSFDYGRTFANKNHLFVLPDGRNVSISRLVSSTGAASRR